MKYTLYDIVAILGLLTTGLATLGLNLNFLEDLEPNLALWTYIVSITIFCMCFAFVSTLFDKIRGKRTELGKEVDALRERIDALERGAEE